MSTYSRTDCLLNNTQLDAARVIPTTCLMHESLNLLPIFALGQLCAWPSVAWWGTYLSQTTIADSFCRKGVGWRAIFWGLVCGVSVSTGYLLYFKAAESVNANVAFCFTATNPLISIFIDALWCKFRKFTRLQWIYLVASVALYLTAVGLLSQCA